MRVLSILCALFASSVVAQSSSASVKRGTSAKSDAEDDEGPQPTIFNGVEVPPLLDIDGEKFSATVAEGWWFVKHHSCVPLADARTKCFQESMTDYDSDPIALTVGISSRHGRHCTNSTSRRSLSRLDLPKIPLGHLPTRLQPTTTSTSGTSIVLRSEQLARSTTSAHGQLL